MQAQGLLVLCLLFIPWTGTNRTEHGVSTHMHVLLILGYLSYIRLGCSLLRLRASIIIVHGNGAYV